MKATKPPPGPQVVEANPDEVYAVITAAASQDPAQVKVATERLKELLEMFGTLDTLQAIACQRNLPLPVRLQSAIQFKNAVVNRWRSRKLLNDEHRQRIRERCLLFIDEQEDLVSAQNEEVVRKIARQDFPVSWPNLLPNLLARIDEDLQQRYVTPSDDPLIALRLRRSLKILGDTLEEFAAYKLLTGVRTMSEITRQYARTLLTYFTTVSSNCIPPAVSLEAFCTPRTQTDLMITKLLFICVFHITTWLWCRNERPGKEIFGEMQEWFYETFRTASMQLTNMVEVRKQLVQFKSQRQPLDNGVLASSLKDLNLHIRDLGHCFRRMQQFSNSQFGKVDSAADVVLYGWSQIVEAGNAPPEAASDDDDALYYVPFLIQAMVLFKDSLSQFAPTIKDKDYKELPNPRAFSQQFVESAVTLLVTRFIPLKPKDLETWVNEPEEWFWNEEPEHERWELELRPCSERLLVTLSVQETKYVVGLLASTFKAMAGQRAEDLNSVIQKEALYTTIGRCAHRLKGEIDFEGWLQSTLVPEAREINANYPIIKRRIAWFLGKWVSENCAAANNAVIWDVLVHLLHDRGPGTDSVVRLTAALALRECIDTIDFSLESFLPYLSVTVGDIIQLLAEAEGTETKRSLCKALNVIVERAGNQIAPFAAAVAHSIQPMWIDAGNEWLLKGSLLDVVTSLTKSIGTTSSGMWDLIIPIIQEVMSPPASQNLDSDGLTLWCATLQSAGAIEEGGPLSLLQLFPILVHLLENNMDLLGQVTAIAESYFFLDTPKVMQLYAQPLLNAYMTCINHKPLEVNLRDLFQNLTLIIRFSPPEMWGEALHTSGIFPHLISLLVDGESGTQVLKEVIYVLCRIALADPKLFLQLMSSATQSMQKPEDKLWEFTLDQWFGRFDNMAEPKDRKLAAMGIAALVSTGHPEPLQRLSTGIFDIWVDVLYETKEAQQQHHGVDSPPTLTRFWEEDEPPHSYYGDSQGTTEEARRTLMWRQDILRTTKLSTCIRDSMTAASAVIGDTAFQQYMSKADPTMLKQLLEQVQA